MSYLQISGLTACLKGTPHRLLRSVSLSVGAGEVRGLVGESGAGKSMIGKAILGILPRSVEIVAGSIVLEGVDLQALSPRDRRRLIGASCALIPQDPLTALNPSRRIAPQITDRLVDILGWERRRAEDRALELLGEVHITDPERVLRCYPHELSGGMRQRILIASAFAAEPRLIIADEPTTALDVTVQKQILRLIREMQQRHNTALVFVTHDLGVVSKVCQTLTVLYGGLVIEDTDVRSFFARPAHPYSQALLAATPRYTDPDGSLTPVPDAVIRAVQAEVETADRTLAHG
ncbi:ATP-binding cassette domain-containing protein [Microvirga tunisiensis]|uniref:ATP-binding cassette domain-containing protein n=2 Tax=Pannonibacter tanglangensis TaxID=2750084 RepID=A0A7X5J8Q7_9HYPH|nr:MULTISPECIES: ABC transporter ATP-binding protein [unclassified Pannonibacter]NBN63866.1 ATP-binding cassette domain-containing protein [Pannonibacter sp. XCT-34]NBN77505.1 ATP-binding cassette domain-containing protein [Pannonibacter sp. XCT-53]